MQNTHFDHHRNEQDTTTESITAMSRTPPRSQSPQWAGNNITQSITAMSRTPARNPSPQWAEHHHAVHLRNEQNTTAESVSAMNRTPQHPSPQWTEHHGVRLRNEQNTAESDPPHSGARSLVNLDNQVNSLHGCEHEQKRKSKISWHNLLK